MKKSLSKAVIAVTLALGIFSVANVADAYNFTSCRWVPGFYGPRGEWHGGHRVCVANYGYGFSGYSVNRCGWVPGHYAPYGWVPGHRACWW